MPRDEAVQRLRYVLPALPSTRLQGVRWSPHPAVEGPDVLRIKIDGLSFAEADAISKALGTTLIDFEADSDCYDSGCFPFTEIEIRWPA